MASAVSQQRSIVVQVNGETQVLPASSSVVALIAELGLAGRKVAVERNGLIVPRGRYAETELADGDQLEIVVAVGGG